MGDFEYVRSEKLKREITVIHSEDKKPFLGMCANTETGRKMIKETAASI